MNRLGKLTNQFAISNKNKVVYSKNIRGIEIYVVHGNIVEEDNV